jgi:hypothetical protein
MHDLLSLFAKFKAKLEKNTCILATGVELKFSCLHTARKKNNKKTPTRCLCEHGETQMLLRVANSIDSNVYVKVLKSLHRSNAKVTTSHHLYHYKGYMMKKILFSHGNVLSQQILM